MVEFKAEAFKLLGSIRMNPKVKIWTLTMDMDGGEEFSQLMFNDKEDTSIIKYQTIVL